MSRKEILAHKHAIDMARAAEYLGVSIQSIRRRIADGSLSAFRVGPRAVRVYVEDVEALKKPVGGSAA